MLFNDIFIIELIILFLICFYIITINLLTLLYIGGLYLVFLGFLGFLNDSDIYIGFLWVIDLGVGLVFFIFILHFTSFLFQKSQLNISFRYFIFSISIILFFFIFYYYYAFYNDTSFYNKWLSMHDTPETNKTWCTGKKELQSLALFCLFAALLKITFAHTPFTPAPQPPHSLWILAECVCDMRSLGFAKKSDFWESIAFLTSSFSCFMIFFSGSVLSNRWALCIAFFCVEREWVQTQHCWWRNWSLLHVEQHRHSSWSPACEARDRAGGPRWSGKGPWEVSGRTGAASKWAKIFERRIWSFWN